MSDKKSLYEFCLSKRDEQLSWFEIHKQVKKLGFISRYVDVEGLKNLYRNLAAEVALSNEVENESFDSKLNEFYKFIGKSNKNTTNAPVVASDGKETTIIISDVHIPYHDNNKLVALFEKWKGKAHRLLIAGDLLNGTQISTHPQMIFEDFRNEVSEGRVVLEYASECFPEVIILDDNHVHSRWQKYIAKNLRPDLHFLTVHPYDYLIAGLPNVKRAKSLHNNEFGEEFGWLYNIGDAYFAHAEISTTDEFKTAKRVKEFIQKWKPVMGWPEPRLVGQAHTHNFGMLHEPDSMLVLTGGLLSLEAVRYSMGPQAAGKPPIHGYVVLVQENGVTNLEETRAVRIPLFA